MRGYIGTHTCAAAAGVIHHCPGAVRACKQEHRAINYCVQGGLGGGGGAGAALLCGDQGAASGFNESRGFIAPARGLASALMVKLDYLRIYTRVS